MISRRLSHALRRSLREYPITVITGPRQSGKTTMLRAYTDYAYVTMEDPDNRAFAQEDPKGFLAEHPRHVIFDEVQRVPDLFSYIQGIVDESKEMGQFILSGSQNFNLMERITQSLAGRADILVLFPLDIDELQAAQALPADLHEVLTTGFYPAIFDRGSDVDRYYANYLRTYINRDVTRLINIQDNAAFRRCLRACAIRASQLTNYNDMARDVGVSHTTLRNWLSILETSYIIYFLEPYHNNFSKRITKSPKLYFHDVGLLCHLLGIRKGNLSPTHGHWGAIFENMVVTEYHKRNAHDLQLREFWFWRSSKGQEVDLLYENDEELNAIEIKASRTIKSEFFKGLNYLEKISNQAIEKALVYGGDKNQNRSYASVRSWKNLMVS